MKFTVRAVGTQSVTVDFEDGSWAEVPYTSEVHTRADLLRQINTYHTVPPVIEEPLLVVGESYDTTPIQETPEPGAPITLLSYGEMRESLYPEIEDQLDAAYWLRHGVSGPQEEIDEAIEKVKRIVPKNIAPMTPQAFSLFLLELWRHGTQTSGKQGLESAMSAPI